MKDQKENMKVIASFIIVACFVGLVIYILMNKKTEIDQDVKSNQIENQNKNDTTLVNKQLTPTTNTMEKISKNGDVLLMNYTGRFTNGKAFDSNILPEFGHVQPFKFTLGAGMVIKGWDEGLLGMKIGEKKTLTISPDKGYGSNDYNGIPGNSTLIFDVELIGIE